MWCWIPLLALISLLFPKSLAFESVPSLISNRHIAQAFCRIHCLKLQVEDCWQNCAEKVNKLKIEDVFEERVQLSVSIRGCRLVWPQPPSPSDERIYQVYTQDWSGAWHNEGQTLENWIHLTPPTWARTKSIQLISVSLEEITSGGERRGQQTEIERKEEATNNVVVVRTSFIALVRLQIHECHRAHRAREGNKTDANYSIKREQRSNELPTNEIENNSTYLAVVVVLVIVCLALMAALISVLYIMKCKNSLK